MRKPYVTITYPDGKEIALTKKEFMRRIGLGWIKLQSMKFENLRAGQPVIIEGKALIDVCGSTDKSK
jgi:hypothetical protein